MAWLGKRNKRNLRRIEYYGCKYDLPHKEWIQIACRWSNQKELLRKEAEGKRKCEKIMRETFGKKNYITKNKVGEVRNIFKARVGMSEFAEVAGPENAAIQNLAALRWGGILIFVTQNTRFVNQMTQNTNVMAFMAAVEKITIYLPEEHDWVISKWENI